MFRNLCISSHRVESLFQHLWAASEISCFSFRQILLTPGDFSDTPTTVGCWFKIVLLLQSVKWDIFCQYYSYIFAKLRNLHVTEGSKYLHHILFYYEIQYDQLIDARSGGCSDEESVSSDVWFGNICLFFLSPKQIAHAKIQSLESSLENLLTRETKMKSLIRTLEQEKMAYQKTVDQIRKLLPADVLANCEPLLRDLNCNPNNKAKTGNKP